MTSYGMPYFLEDKTGRLSGTEYVDIHDRLHYVYRCTARSTSHSTYMIFSASSPSEPLMALNFGPKNALGSVSFSSQACYPMNQYLAKVSTPSGRYERGSSSLGMARSIFGGGGRRRIKSGRAQILKAI
ncbi:hypothetical protein AAF712_013133 [Marasmius tenuissimus]|uniref:Uncharacterized protein n=1 Tax=Marasmius tenuissimus TaxID=585030 RepID=A0ABR2ZGK6_9AGAR